MSKNIQTAHLNLFYHSIDMETVSLNKVRQIVRGRYLPPHRINEVGVGDALFMVSENGNSQIILSESSIALNVNFTPDWQQDPNRCQSYLNERIPLMFGILAACEIDDFIYAGVTTEVTVTSDASDSTILSAVAHQIGGSIQPDQSDLTVRSSQVVEGVFYKNITVANFRTHPAGSNPMPQIRLSYKAATQRGVSIVVDFNSRRAYNEGIDQSVDEEHVGEIVSSSFNVSQEIAESVITRIGKG